MAAFILSMVLLGLLVAAGIASALGRTPDSRDVAYGVGPLLSPRRRTVSTHIDR
jgi:hypothetical protein